MTYLQIVNNVLLRLREDTVDTLSGLSDPVAELVVEFVKDAYLLVSESHNWQVLRDEWEFDTSSGVAEYTLTSSSKPAILETLLSNEGTELQELPLSTIRKRNARSTNLHPPTSYTVSGKTSDGGVKVTLYPIPDTLYTYTAYGWRSAPSLTSDSDVVLMAERAVMFYALANAMRERGEVGGQTAAEVLAVANRHLSDAIARDASLNDLDNVWESV